tara:strand:- start:8129 stop:8410 length:282 start_codon:yes stop_codon:yes gene_type:complete
MNYDEIINQVEKLMKDYNDHNTEDNFKERMEEKYKQLKTHYSGIFNLTMLGKMDMNMLKYMISTIERINNNEISKEKGEYSVGEMLVDKIVKK